MSPTTIEAKALRVLPASAAALAPYGTLIEPGEDGTPFGVADARLDLTQGQPRLYIMTLKPRPLRVQHVTRHRRTTQCLAALEGHDWLIVLAPPDDPDDPDGVPDPARLAAFRIGGRQALALHRGTWHAGPLILSPQVDFLNLELVDTNLTDHQTRPLDRAYRLDLA